CIFSSISAEYTSMLDSLSQNLSCRKDTTAQACREVILDHILRRMFPPFHQRCPFSATSFSHCLFWQRGRARSHPTTLHRTLTCRLCADRKKEHRVALTLMIPL